MKLGIIPLCEQAVTTDPIWRQDVGQIRRLILDYQDRILGQL